MAHLNNLKPEYKLYEIKMMSGSSYVVNGLILDAIERSQSRFIRLPGTGELINLSSIDSASFLKIETRDKFNALPEGEKETAFITSLAARK